MPWTEDDASRFTKKASSPKSKRQWSKVADSALAKGASEGSAIRQANSVVSKRKNNSRSKYRPFAKGGGR